MEAKIAKIVKIVFSNTVGCGLRAAWLYTEQRSSEPPSPSKTEHATRKNCKPTSARYGSGAFLGITGAFCLGGKGTFGQGHLGHKTPHLGVMPQPGAIFCGVLSKVAVPVPYSLLFTVRLENGRTINHANG